MDEEEWLESLRGPPGPSTTVTATYMAQDGYTLDDFISDNGLVVVWVADSDEPIYTIITDPESRRLTPDNPGAALGNPIGVVVDAWTENGQILMDVQYTGTVDQPLVYSENPIRNYGWVAYTGGLTYIVPWVLVPQ